MNAPCYLLECVIRGGAMTRRRRRLARGSAPTLPAIAQGGPCVDFWSDGPASGCPD